MLFIDANRIICGKFILTKNLQGMHYGMPPPNMRAGYPMVTSPPNPLQVSYHQSRLGMEEGRHPSEAYGQPQYGFRR